MRIPVNVNAILEIGQKCSRAAGIHVHAWPEFVFTISQNMHMSKAYIKSVKQNVPEADQRIAFDKFHVAQSLGQVVNKVRIDENVVLIKHGSNLLKGTRYNWLTNPENMTDEQWDDFEPLRDAKLKTAWAWAIRELTMTLWDYKSRAWAIKAWK